MYADLSFKDSIPRLLSRGQWFIFKYYVSRSCPLLALFLTITNVLKLKTLISKMYKTWCCFGHFGSWIYDVHAYQHLCEFYVHVLSALKKLFIFYCYESHVFLMTQWIFFINLYLPFTICSSYEWHPKFWNGENIFHCFIWLLPFNMLLTTPSYFNVIKASVFSSRTFTLYIF